ncbi:ATP-binding protein, partial [Streptomyces griseobrunneus]
PPLPLRADRPAPPAAAPDRTAAPAAVTDGSALPATDRTVPPGADADRTAPAPSTPQRVDRPAPPAARPELPKRSNQEHLVPQLREAPAPRVEDEHALHDPGLMAAFRRGVDLAEAQNAQEDETTGYGDPAAPTALDAPLETLAPLPVRGAAGAPASPGRPQTGHAPFLPGHTVPEPRKDTTFKE